MMKQQDTKPLLGEVTIKTEPGTSSSPIMQRLPSLRPPRDLSLSAYSQKLSNLNLSKNKKIYVPNLNVQRNKPVENSPSVKTDPVKPNLHVKSEKSRGRGKRTFVQLNQGVFAEGVGAQKGVGRGRASGGTGEGSDGVLRRPTLKSRENLKVDKKEEEDTMKQLLRDDFVDDPNLEPDFDNCPVFLPLSKEDPTLKKKSDLKISEKKENITLNEVLCDNVTINPGYILFQMPSTLPGLPGESLVNSTSNPTAASSNEPVDDKGTSDCCVLSTLPAGRVGTLKILKSGRVRLVFGDTRWWLEMGTQTSFEECLMDITLAQGTRSGDMVHMGPLNVRMSTSPDFESIITAAAKANKKPI